MPLFNERYTLTRPKTLAGDKAEFFTYLELLAQGAKFSGYHVRNTIYKYMTFQALREKGLAEYSDGYFRATENGKMYVAIVNSTNKVPKAVLKSLMK